MNEAASNDAGHDRSHESGQGHTPPQARDETQTELATLRAELEVEKKERERLQAELKATRDRLTRALIYGAERDGQIGVMTHTRVWSVAQSYWAMKDSVRSLLRQARCRLRRAATPQTAKLSPMPDADQPVVAHGRGYDVICFPVIDWNYRFQRPQQLCTQFAAAGHRVLYARTTFTPTEVDSEAASPRLLPLADSVYEFVLPAPVRLSVYKDVPAPAAMETFFAAMQTMRRQHQIIDAVIIVDYPFWRSLARRLREAFGWRVIYDCMDKHTGFGAMSQAMLAEERALSREADLVLATSHSLLAEQQALNKHCLLLPNAADFHHFHTESPLAGEVSRLARPIIGYYGAIAEWFDTAVVTDLAARHPDWSFVLIGWSFAADLARLARMDNVHILGERPYEVLPAYAQAFDVCLIPFKRTPLTEATNPVKLYEYLSMGKPVVAISLPELAPFSDLVYLAQTPADFEPLIVRALAEDHARLGEQRVARARQHTWSARFAVVEQAISALYPKVSIIVVTYNNANITKQCLESIIEYSAYPDYEVIVVDNASSDDTREMLERYERQYDNMTIILNDQNRGFAPANNQGLQQARGEIIVYLNNDTVVTTGWLQRMVRHLDDPNVGLVGAVTNAAGNEARIDVSYIDLAQLESFSAGYTWAHDGEVSDIRVAALFCAAMRRADAIKVEGLDERYEIGMFEDDDLAEKVRDILHMRVVCAEDVFIHHIGRASFSRLSRTEYDDIFERNRVRFEQKWQIVWKPHRHRRASFPPASGRPPIS